MKKFYLSFLTILTTVGAYALTISPAVKIDTDGPAHNPVLSPDGKSMLFSSDNHTGLKLLSFGSETITNLDDAIGAGFNPVFTTDGSEIIYQTASVDGAILTRDIHKYNINSGQSIQLVADSRDNITPAVFADGKTSVYTDFDKIQLNQNGIVSTLNPIENAHSYLWASISPDGQKLLFVEPFQGVFVSELDGKNPVKIASKGAFPSWAGENLISFIVSHDDGYVILDSTLKIYDITSGITVNLTDDSILVGESTSAADGTIVYATLDGDIFKITVE